jgi:hypothetical protein
LLTPASENPFSCRLVFLVLTQSFQVLLTFCFFLFLLFVWRFFINFFFVEGFSSRNLETRELAFGGWILEKRSGVWVCVYARELAYLFRFF